MVCIYCSGETKVTNSRLQKKTNQVWRRRQCLRCQAVFSTEEQPVTDKSLLVVKSTGSEPFSREKLLISLYDSLRHRPTAITDAAALLDTIWSRLIPQIDSATLKRNQIVSSCYGILSRFDKPAATSYLAFHPLNK